MRVQKWLPLFSLGATLEIIFRIHISVSVVTGEYGVRGPQIWVSLVVRTNVGPSVI